MGKDRRSSSVDDGKEDFLECVRELGCRLPCSGEYEGEESSVLGVRGDAEPEEDSSLDGDSSGTGADETWDDVVRLVAGWGWVNWSWWLR